MKAIRVRSEAACMYILQTTINFNITSIFTVIMHGRDKDPETWSTSNASYGKDVKKHVTNIQLSDTGHHMVTSTGGPTVPRAGSQPEDSYPLTGPRGVNPGHVHHEAWQPYERRGHGHATYPDHSASRQPPRAIRSQHCSQALHTSTHLPDSDPVTDMTFMWKKKTAVKIMKADITTISADAIVNAANETLQHIAGVAGAIARAAGQKLQWDSTSQYQRHGPLGIADTFVSDAYNLPCQYVIHTVGPMWRSSAQKSACEALLHKAFTNCLKKAEKLKLATIAIPAISCG